MDPLTPTLATLPYEIISHVCDFLDISSLKQFRLVNHAIESPAHGALFSTLRITTTIASLNHAKSVACFSDQSTKVETIAYHASSLVNSLPGRLNDITDGSQFGRPCDFAEFDNLMPHLFQTPQGSTIPWEPFLPQSVVDLWELWQEYEAIWRARRELESDGYVSQRLRGLMNSFPNVTTVRLIPVTSETPYKPGEHFPYFCRVDENAFADILSACYDRGGIRCLSATGLLWGSFRACNDLRVLCGGLRELDLAIDNRHIILPYDTMRKDFADFLGLCQNLEMLTLELGIIPCTEYQLYTGHRRSEPIQMACNSVLGMIWSKLESVQLSGFHTSERNIKGFFLNNSASLRSTRFESLQIYSPYEGTLSKSIIDIEKQVTDTLRSCQDACHRLGKVRVEGEIWQERPNVEVIDGVHRFYEGPFLYEG